MEKKRYEIEVPAESVTTHRGFTVPQLEQLKASCEKALVQAEQDKPQVWDFGINIHGRVRIRGLKVWSVTEDPCCFMTYSNEPHILGNLKRIVEQEGPIVVGFSLEEADFLFHALPERNAGPGKAITDRVITTMRRYERNKPCA